MDLKAVLEIFVTSAATETPSQAYWIRLVASSFVHVQIEVKIALFSLGNLAVHLVCRAELVNGLKVVVLFDSNFPDAARLPSIPRNHQESPARP